MHPPVLYEVGPPGAVKRLYIDGHGGVARRILHNNRTVLCVKGEDEMIDAIRASCTGMVGEFAHVEGSKHHRSFA